MCDTLSAKLVCADIKASGKRAAVIVDGYEIIEGSSAAAEFETLFSALPGNLVMVLASRTMPAVRIMRGILEEGIILIEAADLLLSDDEADDLIAPYGLPDVQRERVKQLAGGWASCLKLLATGESRALGAGERPVRINGEEMVLQYLIEEIVSPLPADARLFFAISSVTDEVNRGLANHLIGVWNKLRPEQPFQQDSTGYLDLARHFNLFSSQSRGADPSYHFYAQLRGAFSRYLYQGNPEVVRFLRTAACDWYLDQGRVADAMELAIEDGQWDRAVFILADQGIEALGRGWWDLTWQWIASLPVHMQQESPIIPTMRAFSAAMVGRRDQIFEATYWSEKAEVAIRSSENTEMAALCAGLMDIVYVFMKLSPQLPGLREDFSIDLSRTDALPAETKPNPASYLLKGWGALYNREPEQAIAYFQMAQDHAMIARNLAVLVDTVFWRAATLAQCGRALDALVECDAAIALLANRLAKDDEGVSAPILIAKGYILQHIGRVAEARKLLDVGLERLKQHLFPYYQFFGQLGRFEIALHDHDPLLARRLAGDIGTKWPDAEFCADALMVKAQAFFIGSNENTPDYVSSLLSVRSLLSSTWHAGPLCADYLYETAVLSYLQAAAVAGDPVVCAEIMGELSAAMAEGLPSHVKHTLIASRALALYRAGDSETAFDLLAKLSSASSGVVLYRGSLSLNVSFQTLIERARKQGMRANATDRTPAILTKREAEILVLVGKGRSNKAIASTIGISEGTVKQHLTRAMTKLGAHNRTQAFLIAQDLDLL